MFLWNLGVSKHTLHKKPPCSTTPTLSEVIFMENNLASSTQAKPKVLFHLKGTYCKKSKICRKKNYFSCYQHEAEWEFQEDDLTSWLWI
jgi:hypothetical protein